MSAHSTKTTHATRSTSNGSRPKTNADPRPLVAHALLVGVYVTLNGCAVALLRSRSERILRLKSSQLVLFGIATSQLTRLIAKDTVTSFLRAPFTRFKRATGEGEVEEEVIGSGLRHAVGELITCPYCLAPWMASTLLALWVAAPTLTEAIVDVATVSRVSDFCQLAYDRAKPS